MKHASALIALFFILPACGGGTTGSSAGSSSAGSSSAGSSTGTGSTSSTSGTSGASSTGSTGGVACGPDVKAPDAILPDTTDPEQGVFTLDEALVELPAGPGPLRAIIDTDVGVITCELKPSEVPNAVANFVGLARGLRPWKDPVAKKWVKRKFYDGLTFHRVIPDFVAQGGDPLGTGFGGPGYKFNDEIAGLSHIPGTLAYANSGANTNGSQFYITETAQTQLDPDFTIFGFCSPVSVVTALTHVPTDANGKPTTPLHMKTVTITRCAP